jgi:hypothetical protein
MSRRRLFHKLSSVGLAGERCGRAGRSRRQVGSPVIDPRQDSRARPRNASNRHTDGTREPLNAGRSMASSSLRRVLSNDRTTFAVDPRHALLDRRVLALKREELPLSFANPFDPLVPGS